MSFVHQIPYLGALNHGATLRTKATKLQSYAELDAMRGGKFGEKLAAFWADQKARLAQDHGLPSDGLNLEVPGLDPRMECYRVLSSVRLSGHDDHKASWNAFCDYFVNKWAPVAPLSFKTDLPATKSMASGDTLSVETQGGKAPFSYEWFKDGAQVGSGATLSVTASGKYQVHITDSLGTDITSQECTVTVAAAKNGAA